MHRIKHFLITGKPGSGKTTLIKEVLNSIRSKNVAGFYTEEIRTFGKRKGFKIVTVPEKRTGLLAHVEFKNGPRIGKYGVNLTEFERLVLPILERETELLIVDEIGGMELLSFKFEKAIKKLLEGKTPCILGTLQQKRIKLLKEWGVYNNVELVTLDFSNRESVKRRIFEWLQMIPL